MERRIIMCRRHPVLAFDYDPSSGKAVGSGRILDCSRLPLELISHGKPAIYAKTSMLGGEEGPSHPLGMGYAAYLTRWE